jgi:hypothetical protein
MLTPWTSDRYVYMPIAYEINGVIYVTPDVYAKLRDVASLSQLSAFGTRIMECAYLSDYRWVSEPSFKGWWV